MEICAMHWGKMELTRGPAARLLFKNTLKTKWLPLRTSSGELGWRLQYTADIYGTQHVNREDHTHRRSIELEDKAKVVLSVWGTESLLR